MGVGKDRKRSSNVNNNNVVEIEMHVNNFPNLSSEGGNQ